MNITDKLYNEWAWRTKSGTPDMNNPEDKAILDRLISELTEEKELTGKAKLLQLIKDTDLSDDQIQRIETGIINIGYKDDVFQKLKDIGYTEDAFKSKGALEGIFKQLGDTDLNLVLNYLNNPVKLVAGKHKVHELTNLPEEVVRSLFNIEPGMDAGGSAIGPGEVGLALLFSNVDNRSGGGDLNWDSTNLEVKKNEGRFGQQGGRSSSLNAFEFLAKDVLDDEAIEQLNSMEGNKAMSYAISNLAKVAKQEGVDMKKVLSGVTNIIDQLYYSKNHASTFITADNIMDPVKLKKAILKINMNGYMDKNNIQSVLFWNPASLEYFTFGKKDINTVVDNRLIDTTDAKKTNSALGYNWNNPYPKLFFI